MIKLVASNHAMDCQMDQHQQPGSRSRNTSSASYLAAILAPLGTRGGGEERGKEGGMSAKGVIGLVSTWTSKVPKDAWSSWTSFVTPVS